jgi:hypothetical protein
VKPPAPPPIVPNPNTRWRLNIALWIVSTLMLVDEYGRRRRRR